MIKSKVLFVCLGNICRSPAAEAVFQALVNNKGFSDQFDLDSAGTNGLHDGENADARMIKAASLRDIDVPSISRKFVKKDLEIFDHIIVMDDSNYENVVKLDDGSHVHKVSKMTDYCSGEFSKYDHVLDPYFGGEDGFNHVLDLLDNACLGLLQKIS